MTAGDETFMRRALELARKGLYTTAPNPRVGCVLVRDGRLIGEGFHERAGEAHAEVRALADADARGETIAGATAYVTLEPCNHVGRTGPCTEALIEARVARVVAAMADPDAQARNGASRLREAGIRVDMGVLEREAHALNRGFVSRITRGRPFVRMKIAASLDGRTALGNGRSQWITGPEARRDGHHWRAQACAVVTGIGTIRHDNPQLTVREVASPRQPVRIVIDRHAQTPADARVLQGGAIVVTAGERNPAWPRDVEVMNLADAQGRIDLARLMRELARRGMNEIHIEAGAGLNGALLEQQLVDELLLYLAPCLIADPARGMAQLATPLQSLDDRIALEIATVERIGPDLRVLAEIKAR